VAVSPRNLSRAISRTRIQHVYAPPRQALIALFAKILSAVPAQAESKQTNGTKHGYSVAGVAAATAEL
jgi:hypothetical protein